MKKLVYSFSFLLVGLVIFPVFLFSQEKDTKSNQLKLDEGIIWPTAYEIGSDRDPFSRTMKAEVIEVDLKAVKAKKVEKEKDERNLLLTQITLQATINVDNVRIAFLSYPNKKFIVKVNDDLGDFKVKEIKDTEVVLLDRDKEYIVLMDIKKRRNKVNKGEAK